ncbi:hypothetical protein ACNKHK_11285 [Shigella flexneri]
MDTMIFRAPLGSRLRLKRELRRYYTGWDLLKYNEDVGELHRTDVGNRLNYALQQCWRVKRC